jgi:hypothetical protein
MHLEFRRFACCGILLALAMACGIQAPQYEPAIQNVMRLQKAEPAPIKLGTFQADPESHEDVNHLTVRGNVYSSPYKGSFVSYLKEALYQDLQEAQLFSPSATIEISGLLVKNEIHAAGSTKANAFVEARFIVTRDGQVRFNKVLSSSYDWDSNFLGAIALPRAADSFPVNVKRILAQLYSDPEFIAAVKK